MPDFNDTNTYPVAILAGGQGSRLKTRSGNLPKPMVPVLGLPLLERQIALCARAGFDRVLLLVHYQHEVISDHFGDGSRFGVSIGYAVEGEARGTAGALHDALPRLADNFLVLYGDTYLDVDLQALWSAHNEAGAAATLFLHPNDHPADSDLVEVDVDLRVRRVHPYPHPSSLRCRNLVNAGLYALNKQRVSGYTPLTGKSDIAKHVFPAMLTGGEALRAHITPEYIKDMGTPERLDKVESDIDRDLPGMLSSRRPRSAVFLDRDGTIVQEVGHLRTPEQIALIPGAGEAIRRINRSGRLAIVATNQPVIARGDVTEEGLAAIHAEMDMQLGEAGAFLDAVYHCPHHPHRGYAGEVAALKRVCTCRKPAPGMIHRGLQELGVGASDSWMIGDTSADIEAAMRAGVRPVLVRTGHGAVTETSAALPQICRVFDDLAAATQWVLQTHAELSVATAVFSAETCRSRTRLMLIAGDDLELAGAAAIMVAEQLQALGQTAHLIGHEGTSSLCDQILTWAHSEHRRDVDVPAHATRTGLSTGFTRRRSMGTADTLVVIAKDVATLSPQLLSSCATRLQVRHAPDTETTRLTPLYAMSADANAAAWATHLLVTGNTP
jgi:histidinol-phosphate phosphatase family protein